MGAKPYILDSSEDEAIWNIKLIGIFIMQELNYGATWVIASLSKHIIRLKDDWAQMDSLRHLDLTLGNNAVTRLSCFNVKTNCLILKNLISLVRLKLIST